MLLVRVMALLTAGVILNVIAGGTGGGSDLTTTDAPALRAIVVNSGGQFLPFNEIQQFIATASYANVIGKDVTDQVTWSSSSRNVATVSSASHVTGMAGGTTSIAASLEGVTGSKTLTSRNLRLPASVLSLHADV